MTKKIVFAVALSLGIVSLAAPRAYAACNPPKFASTYNPATQAYVYWTTSVQEVEAGLVGRLWSGNTDYTGTCNDYGFLYFSAYPRKFGMSLALGNACVPPGLCPSGNLNFKAWVLKTDGTVNESYSRQVPETPAGGVNFDFSDVAVTMVPTPRPRALSTSRVGNTVTINTYPETIPGDAASVSTVTACNVRSAASPTNPGSSASAYPTLVATAAASGGTCPSMSVPVECGTVSQWLVLQIVTTAGPDAYVGPATQLRCNTALADPKTKISPKKNVVGARN